MRAWFLRLAAAGSLAAAVPALAVNQQIVIGFDDLAPGTGDFSIDAFGDPEFGNSIFGGIITVATLAEPAVSGTQVYRGTAIGFNLDDPFNYSWPAVGAFVTGSAPITLTLRAFDPDLAAEVVVFTTTVSGGTANVYLGAGDEMMPGFFTSALFESAAAFNIDDLTLGLVNVSPGIPEPATWTLLISGFGMIGAASRRRRGSRSSPSNILTS